MFCFWDLKRRTKHFSFRDVTLILENRNTQISALTVNSVRSVKHSVFKWLKVIYRLKTTHSLFIVQPVSLSNLHLRNIQFASNCKNRLGRVRNSWWMWKSLLTLTFVILTMNSAQICNPSFIYWENGDTRWSTLVLQMDWRNWTGCSFCRYVSFIDSLIVLIQPHNFTRN